MSLSHILADPPLPPHPPAQPAEPDNQDVRAPYRSWRKKFRKLRLKFNKSYNEGVTLIKDEHKALILARRLQEQNDQLLDLLLDLNDSAHIPPHLRFTLRSPSPSASAVPSLEPDTDAPAPPPVPKPLSALSQIPHTRSLPSPNTLPHDLTLPELPGYLTPTHEEEYLSSLDTHLKDPSSHNADDTLGRPLRPLDRPTLTEKDLMSKNPNSVYNWLRRNQPDVFIQEREQQHNGGGGGGGAAGDGNGHGHAASEKAGKASAGGPAGAASRGQGKRASMAAAAAAAAMATPKGELDAFDEEIGFAGEAGGSARGKRSKDDEPYRPKGGSSRPSKRKREEGEKGSRKKVARGSNVGAGAGGAETPG